MDKTLERIMLRYDELTQKLSQQETMADPSLWQKLMKEHAQLEPMALKCQALSRAERELRDAQEMLREQKDPELQMLAREEAEALSETVEALEKELTKLMTPKDPTDEKDIYMEIRAGAGGDEASLFAQELFRMYTRYAEMKGWETKVISLSESGLGGIKEIVFRIGGVSVYSRLKYESGVHRVQRVPTTESGGRIHTSTVTVAVLPEAEDVEVTIDPGDLRIDVYRSSGHGGQSVNTTDSAVRVTHLPTGIVVTCQDEKSQLKNRDQAIRVLKSRLLQIEQQKQHDQIASNRRSQVGTGDRSEKIRTYNFPQNRVTDHRIGYTTHRIGEILNGDLDEIIDKLIQFYLSKA